MVQYPPLKLCELCKSFFTDTLKRKQIFTEQGHEYTRTNQMLEESYEFGCEICRNPFLKGQKLCIKHVRRDGNLIMKLAFSKDYVPQWHKSLYATNGT